MNSLDDKNLTKEARITRKRLLEAAEEMFAQKGFDGTAIRDITTKASRGPASVNYFFGDKRELYEELFRLRLREMNESRLNAINTFMSDKGKLTLEKLLYAYAVDFLKPFADPQQSQRFMQLFFREMAEQRLPRNMFLDELAAPTLTAMEKAIAVIYPNINEHDALMSILSLTGQLVHITQVKVLFEGAQGHSITSINIEESINHIVKFSAAGIRAYAKGDRK
ncbi:MAG: CerR family C-terminal domain-containing protein [Sedimentisphaerales bacterium]|jgi:AcrR family transcriptional regulator